MGGARADREAELAVAIGEVAATRQEVDALWRRRRSSWTKAALPADALAAAAAGRTAITANAAAPRGGLAAELAAMKRSSLRKRARADGADEDALEAADDSDDPKRALVALVLELRAAVDAEVSGGADKEAELVELTARLEGLKPSARRKAALDAGATEAEITEADDCDDPRAAMIRLVVNRTA